MAVHYSGVERKNCAFPKLESHSCSQGVWLGVLWQHSTATAFFGPLSNLVMLISISDCWFNSLVSVKFPAMLCCVQLDLISLVYL